MAQIKWNEIKKNKQQNVNNRFSDISSGEKYILYRDS